MISCGPVSSLSFLWSVRDPSNAFYRIFAAVFERPGDKLNIKSEQESVNCLFSLQDAVRPPLKLFDNAQQERTVRSQPVGACTCSVRVSAATGLVIRVLTVSAWRLDEIIYEQRQPLLGHIL